MVGPGPPQVPGIEGLASALLERAFRDAIAGRTTHGRRVVRKSTVYRWAVMPSPAADAVYAWLLRSGRDSPALWCAVLDLDLDYFHDLAYEAVEEGRRNVALGRCERMGRILEQLCGV